MMTRWRIDLTIWPYSQVKRPSEDTKLIVREEPMRGAEKAHVFVDADGFREAARMADAVIAGVMLDDRVWQVKLRGLQDEGEITTPTAPAPEAKIL